MNEIYSHLNPDLLTQLIIREFKERLHSKVKDFVAEKAKEIVEELCNEMRVESHLLKNASRFQDELILRVIFNK